MQKKRAGKTAAQPRLNESERRHVFHVAGKRFSIDDTDWTGDRKNQLVLIGRDIDHTTLREQLQACVVY